jgi:hypothetical protein
MDAFILFLHSWGRWLVLGAAAFAVLQWLRPGNAKLERLSRLALLATVDLETTLGLIRWAKSYLPLGQLPVSALMKNAGSRFFFVEHPLMMVLALVALHVGSVRARKAADGAGARRAWAIPLAVGLLLILAAIPWPFRTALGRGWFMPWPG